MFFSTNTTIHNASGYPSTAKTTSYQLHEIDSLMVLFNLLQKGYVSWWTCEGFDSQV